MSASRKRARRLALQALYQWDLGGQSAADISAQFLASDELGKADVDYFEELLNQVSARAGELDEHIAPLLDRPIAEVDPVERAILRMGAYELARRIDVPYRVVINEGVELAKTFGAEQGHRFVNGVLDKLAARLRAAEVEARGGRSG
ncbi:MAG TPA: transcription antitermination factor NusB [Gammaproteobacteria bacterium]|nr:transcription antitermination factor NusB [Gammaproteobacteria bacterium]